jgi:hypothetical protein
VIVARLGAALAEGAAVAPLTVSVVRLIVGCCCTSLLHDCEPADL